jgi:hypothetical protein
MRRFCSIGLVLVVAFSILGAAASGTAQSAAGAERVPVTCFGVWSNSGEFRGVRILTPDFPYWLIDLIPGAPVPTVQADGVAVFTPSGRVNVVCHDNPAITPGPDGQSFADGSSNLSVHGPAFTARGAVPFSFSGIRTYVGTGSVGAHQGHFQISAQLQLDVST